MRLTLLLSLFLIVSCNKESYDLSISKKEESIFIYMIAYFFISLSIILKNIRREVKSVVK